MIIYQICFKYYHILSNIIKNIIIYDHILSYIIKYYEILSCIVKYYLILSNIIKYYHILSDVIIYYQDYKNQPGPVSTMSPYPFQACTFAVVPTARSNRPVIGPITSERNAIRHFWNLCHVAMGQLSTQQWMVNTCKIILHDNTCKQYYMIIYVK